MTPGASRPGSALSTSTSVSGVLYRRTTQSARKPRPASIAGTGMSIDSMSMTHIDPFHPIRAVLIEINVCFFFFVSTFRRHSQAEKRETTHSTGTKYCCTQANDYQLDT